MSRASNSFNFSIASSSFSKGSLKISMSYFDDRLNLYTYDIYLDKFVLSQKRISQVNSFKFFNNSLIIKNNDVIKAYNLKNGNIFWSFEIK